VREHNSKQKKTMKTITTPNPTLKEWIEQMRLIGIQKSQAVQIHYNNVQAIAEFYVKGENVDTRKLYRL
jgi:sporulation protein YlmC with PRC-barrel domain